MGCVWRGQSRLKERLFYGQNPGHLWSSIIIINSSLIVSPIFIIVTRTRHSLPHTGWWNLEFRSGHWRSLSWQIVEFQIFSRILYTFFYWSSKRK